MKRKHKNDRLQARIKRLDKYYSDNNIGYKTNSYKIARDLYSTMIVKFHSNADFLLYDVDTIFLVFELYIGYYVRMNTLIPENNLNYPKDKIITLGHLESYIAGEMDTLQEKKYIEAIQTLTDIDISNIINEKPDDTIIAQTKQNIINTIQNMSKEEFNRRMNKLVDRLQSHYLPTLYMWEEQVAHITEFLSQVYEENALYQDIFLSANKAKHDVYDYLKLEVEDKIEEFNAKYK